MADNLPPLPTGFSEVKSKSIPSLPSGYTEVKKKVSTPAVPNGGDLSSYGGQSDPNFLISSNGISLSPITSDALKIQQPKAKVDKSAQALLNRLSPSERANIDKYNQLAATKQTDQLTSPTQEERAHQDFMQTTAGKALGAVAYLGSKATKGTLQILKGVAHLASGMTANPLGDLTTETAFNQLDKKSDFELTKSDVANQESGKGGKALSALGMAAEFAPAVATGEAVNAPKALLYLQGLGQGKELADNLETAGAKLNPIAKETLIQGTGAVNLLLTDIFKGSKISSSLQDKITTGIAADALKESAGKELTVDTYKELIQKKAQDFATKFERAPIEAMRHYNETAKTFTKLNVGSFALHKAVDSINDKPVFNENLGNLVEQEQKSLTQDAPIFSAVPVIKELTKLLPNNGYKNDVVDAVMKNPSSENVLAIKDQLTEHGFDKNNQQQWTPEEMDATFKHVDKIAEAARTLPRDISENKRDKSVGLVLDRNELQDQLNSLTEAKKQLDPSIQEIPTAKEQYLTDKIEQANDKLRDIVKGSKTTYSKERDDKGQETGKFLKTNDGQVEEITPTRYDLERTERDAREKLPTEEIPIEQSLNKEPNEQATETPQTELPVQQESEQSEPTEENSKPVGEAHIGETNETPLNEVNSENAHIAKTVPGEPDIPTEASQEAPAENVSAIEQTGGNDPIGISKEETKKQREIRGLEDLPESQKTTLSNMFEAGKESVENKSIDPRKIATDVSEKPRNLSHEEVNALLYDRRRIRDEIADIYEQENSGSESSEVLSNRQAHLESVLDENERALRSGANQNALALVAMRNMINADYTLASQKSRMRVAAGGELTEAMTKELERYSKELDEANKKIAKYERRQNDEAAKKEIEKAKRATTKLGTKERLAKDREQIRAEYSAKLKEMRGAANDVFKASTEFLKATAPFVVKMVSNLVQEGVTELKDVVARIKDELDIKDVEDSDVIDMISGKYREKKDTQSELTIKKQEIKRLAVLTSRLEKLKTGEIPEKQERNLIKKRQEIVDLEKQVKDLQKQLGLSPEERSKESLKRQIERINNRIKAGDFEKPERVKIKVDPEAITLKAKVQKAKNNFDAMAERLNSHKKTNYEKGLDTYTQIRRLMLLSGTKTLAKLYSFAALRSVTTPIEEVVNSLNSKVPGLRKIAEQSPRFKGGFSPEAEAKAIITRVSKATLKDSWVEVLKTGSGELDRLYGKHGVDKDFDLNPSALEFFGRLHGAFKNSTKRAEFFRSYQKRLQAAAEQGQDINDTNVQFPIGQEAYADAKRAILMNDNFLVDGYKGLLRSIETKEKGLSGKTFATAIRSLFPIVKIPVNYVLETSDFATGGIRALPYIVKAMVHGAESLSPKQADMVLRTLAKGQVGIAAMVIAYNNPQMFGGYYSGKRDKGDLKAGDVVINGHVLPHWLSHNPILEAMQIAATMRRAIDAANGNGIDKGIMDQLTTKNRDAIAADAIAQEDKHNPNPQTIEVKLNNQFYNAVVKGGIVKSIVHQGGIRTGLVNSVKGISEQIPFTSVGDLANTKKTFGNIAGEALKNQIEPRLLQEGAELLDKDSKSNFTEHPIDYLLSDQIKRDPQTFTDQLKMGVPGLRQEVSEKKNPELDKLKLITFANGQKIELNEKQIEERQKINDTFLNKYGNKLELKFKNKGLTKHDIDLKIKRVVNDYSNKQMIRIVKKQSNGKLNFVDE